MAFEAIKARLCGNLLLQRVNPDKPFVLRTDASGYAVGASLEQMVDEVRMPTPGLGTNSQEEHFMLIEKFLQTCLENNVRVKLPKCDFIVEELDYLGFHIGFAKWSASPTKVQAILSGQIRNLKDLRRFLGAMDFYRRHVKKYTSSSAP